MQIYLTIDKGTAKYYLFILFIYNIYKLYIPNIDDKIIW